MSNKMLIDATHPEETRVVVLRGNRVEEFDFEAADRQQLRGNIYLAKVTRVEPSLQAAFVEYGGNRHGFLAFSEIHPDYYQIPFADRQALIQEQAREEEEDAAEEAAEEAAAEAAEQETVAEFAAAESDSGPPDSSVEDASDPTGEATFDSPVAESPADDRTEAAPEGDAADTGPAMAAERAPDDEISERVKEDGGDGAAPEPRQSRVEEVRDHDEAEQVESVGAVDALEEVPQRRRPRPRQYKIQEVIKRRQVLLVQVVKEERGNKGAALTTYLSLAGRYSVLMPNTGRGGGISRKITNPADRKRLKEIAGELDVPEGMGVILRTAGANRTKPEVKRDFEYLLRLWENVRELTLRSSAPKLVYEEGSLIKRSIRDLYSREIEQIEVAGEDAYREAKDFMRMLMPSHAKNVQLYRDDSPLFARSGVEAQLDAMFSPQVTLRSGGYIVINQTEALVSIDVNSGRSTREHSIEDTALNTNLEAAEEIARQLRLRDLAGLIVIDYIDMEEKRNNRAVERKMKDCLRADRARIQVGRISHFGLMEMSRQRLRTGVLESSTVSCPHCRGTGQVRSISSLSLQILRALEDNLLRHGGYHLYARTRPDAALYVLNQKRRHLAQLEARFGVTITVSGDAPDNGAGFSVERGGQVEERPERPERVAQIAPPEDYDDAEGIDVVEPEDDAFETADEPRDAERPAEGRDKRRRRRRRRGGVDDRPERTSGDNVEEIEAGADEQYAEEESAGGANRPAAGGEDEENGQDARRRRRGRRGGRRRGRSRENGDAEAQNGGPDFDQRAVAGSEEIGEAAFAPADPSQQEAHFADQQESRQAADDRDDGTPDPGLPLLEEAASRQVSGVFGDAEPAAEQSAASPEPSTTDADAWAPIAGEAAVEDEQVPDETAEIGMAPEPVAVAEPVAEQAASAPQPIEDDRPKRSGWWSRKVFF